MKVHHVCSLFLAAAFSLSASAQIQTAGNLLVNIDATGLPLGPVASVPNTGTAGGTFDATGVVDVDQPVVVPVAGGAKAIMFDGHNFMEHVSAPGVVQPAPPSLVGNNPQCSIEAWVINPTLFGGDIETIVAWGTRNVGLGNMAFGYSSQGDHGAVDRWGGNMAWNPVPAAATWHHLVYTFDGATTKIYADGVLSGTLAGGINTVAGQPITLAAQRNQDGTIIGWGGARGSMSIAKLRIHSAPLTASQVSNNFNAEKASFTTNPTALTARPVHRYSFNNAASADAVGANVADTGTSAGDAAQIKGTPGTATFTGTAVHLSGGDSSTAPYVDLPNGIVSSLSASGGGSGEISLEGWLQVTGTERWPRYFDIGATTEGELTDIGGGGTGVNYWNYAQVDVFRDWSRTEISNNGYNGGPGTADAPSYTTRDFGTQNGNAPYGLNHYVATWKESTGEVIVYENGIEATRYVTDKKFNHIQDVNVWLGRSNWTPDQNLQGDYDEFRVYNHVLTPSEVINDYLAGADAVAVEPGTLQSLRLQLTRTNFVAGTLGQATLIADYQNVQNVNVTTRSGVTFQSDTPSVLTISNSGAIQAVSPGAAKITASYGGQSVQLTATVTPIVATLQHRYSFNDSPDSGTVSDSVGGSAGNGTLIGTATLSGTQVVLDGQGSYVELPPNIIGSQSALTIESWATFGPNSPWVRLFDFGDQLNGNGLTTLFLSPHDGGGSVNLSMTASQGARFVARPGPLDNQTNVHIVAVINPDANFMGLYINGLLVASRNDVTIPISGVNVVNSWIGRSMYNADPYLVGSVDEFRIYDGTLTPQRIAIDAAAGPNTLVTDPGALQSVTATVPTLLANTSGQAQFTGNFANVQNVNLFAYGAPTITSDNTGVVTVDANGTLHAVAPGTANVTFTFNGQSVTKAVSVTAPTPVLRHRYNFNTDTPNDIVGSANGTLQGDAAIADGKLTLDAGGGYLELPPHILDGYYALTVEAWASFGLNGRWVRLWDFGSQTPTGGGDTSIFFSPHTGPDGMELTTFVPGRNDHVSVTTNLDNTTDVHIVGVYFPGAGYQELYLNGVLVGRNAGASIPLSAVNDENNWIGRSLFNADPYLNASIDELRIYEGALSADQIAADFSAGPNAIGVVSPKLAVTHTGNTLRISWPSTATTGGYVLQSSSSITGPWAAAGLSTTTSGSDTVATDTIPATAGMKFYRLIRQTP